MEGFGLDPDAPWAVNVLLLLLCFGVVPAVTVWVTNRPTKRLLKRTAADARTAADQTANSHADAEYPNLRDEVTSARQSTEKLTRAVADLADAQQATREDIGGLHSELRDARKDIAGLRTDGRRDRRAVAEQRRLLDEHIAECSNTTT